MSLEEAFAPILIMNQEIVRRDTWGHLAPEPGHKYRGYIVVAKGVFGSNIIWDYAFDDLPDNPWLADDLCNFAFDKTKDFGGPGLYLFKGWYKKFKNGRYCFGGSKFTKIEVA